MPPGAVQQRVIRRQIGDSPGTGKSIYMTPLRPLILSQPAVLSSLALALALTVGTALLGVMATRRVADANRKTAASHEKILTIQQVMTAVADAETGQRGFLLTGDDKYLQPYHRAMAGIPPRLESLRKRFADEPAQIKTLDQLASLIEVKRAESEKTISLREKGALAAALNIVEADDGHQTMQAIRKALAGLELAEVRGLKEEGDLLEARAYRYQFLIIGLIGLAILLTALAGVLMALRLRELATMITVCAWTKRVKWRGRWVSFEEFLEQRFKLRFTHGISEEAARQFQVEAYELHEASEARVPPKPAAP